MINKHIEIVSSTEHGLSSMGEVSRAGAQAALANYFSTVTISIVNTISDLQALIARKPDLVFLGMTFLPVNPALGWEDPEKVWLSDYLDHHGIAYTGSSRLASILERNKHLAKQYMLDAGLKTSRFFLARRERTLRRTDIRLTYPLFVKPANRGGGLGIDSDSLVHTFEQLSAKVRAIATGLHSDALIEQYLPGREFSVALLRQEDSDQLSAMPIELIAPPDQNGARILSGKVKSLDTERFSEVDDAAIKSKLTTLALGAFQALGGRDYGRIDIRLDADGEPHFLEANLLPSLIDGYGNFPKACALNLGLKYEQVMLRIAKLGLSREVTTVEEVLGPLLVRDSVFPSMAVVESV